MESQPAKAKSPILVTLSGMLILERELQLKNTPFSILVTLFGILMLTRVLQFANAHSPIVVTLSGILMLVRELQPWYLLLVDYQYYTL